MTHVEIQACTANPWGSAMVTLSALHIYPVKSCRGLTLSSVEITCTGLAHDREWLIVDAKGKFVTQRDEPRLALIKPTLTADELSLSAPRANELRIALQAHGQPVEVQCWRDRCAAFDAGDAAAAWLEAVLGAAYRLVRFDTRQRRLSNRQWTGAIEAENLFSDGYPLLGISRASLEDLNSRLATPLPMERFRPNLVFSGLPAYGEDDLHELHATGIRLRIVKPCTRCQITTIDQRSGSSTGDEPLRTLRGYRFNSALHGVLFGQNMVTIDGVGQTLRVGLELDVTWRDGRQVTSH